MKVVENGTPKPAQKKPPIASAMRVTIVNIQPNGNIEYEYEVVEPPAGTPGAGTASNAGGSSIGLKGTLVVTSRGQHEATDVDSRTLEGMSEDRRASSKAAHESLQNAALILPEETVGVGATWETAGPVEAEGKTLDQRSKYTLMALTGDAARIAVDQVTRDTSGLPDLGRGRPDYSMVVKLAGQTEVDLGWVTPRKSTFDMVLETGFKLDAESFEAKIEMELSIEQL